MTFKDFLKEMDSEGHTGERDSPIRMGGPETTVRPDAIQTPQQAVRSSMPPKGRLFGTRWLDKMNELPAEERPNALWMWMQSEQAHPSREEFMQMLELIYQDRNEHKGV